MLTGHYTDVEAEVPALAGARATVRWLISKRQGAPHFAMRVIEIAEPGGAIPLHRHDYEHEIFVLEGTGRVLEPGSARELVPGDFVYVEPGEEHGFENAGRTPFRFICVIPDPS